MEELVDKDNLCYKTDFYTQKVVAPKVSLGFHSECLIKIHVQLGEEIKKSNVRFLFIREINCVQIISPHDIRTLEIQSN